MIRRLVIAIVLIGGVLGILPGSPADAHWLRDHRHESHDHETGLPPLTCPTGNAPLAVTTDVRLTHDLDCTDAGWTIAPGVTVDLGGHTVTVTNNPAARCQVEVPGCTFEVGSGILRNGRLVGADVNVGDGRAERLGIRNALAEVTGSGELTRSIIDGGQVVLERGGRLTRSWVVRGDGVLLWNLDHSLTGFQVSDNVIVESTGPGVRLNTHFFFEDDVTGTIQRNFIAHNAGAGISLTGDLRDLGAIDLSGNLVIGNGGTGIVVTGALDSPQPVVTGGPVTLTRNRAIANGGQGINASWMPGAPSGIVDGGQNVAKANAVAPACVGVTCTSHQ